MTYEVLQRPGDGLALLFSMEHGRQLFTRGRLRRRGHTFNVICSNCRRELLIGDDAYRAVGNAMNRYERVCVKCVETPTLPSPT